jgi:hypothetical protein
MFCAWVSGCSGLRSGLEKRWCVGVLGCCECHALTDIDNDTDADLALTLRLALAPDRLDCLSASQPDSTRLDSPRLDSVDSNQASLDPSLLGQVHFPAQAPPLPAQDLPGFPRCSGRWVPGGRDRGVDQFGHSAARSILPDPVCIALQNCALPKTGPHLIAHSTRSPASRRGLA